MEVRSKETLEIIRNEDIVNVCMTVKDRCKGMSFSLVAQTKVMTAASELARNTLEHGGGGAVTIETLADEVRLGIKLSFRDQGPGINDVNLALKDGYSSKKGLGLGLSGSKRIMDNFEIESTPGKGTTIIVDKWS